MVNRRLALAGVALAALLWSPSEALAQCSGQPNANSACAGPASGGPGLPSFRPLITNDLPATVGTVKSVSVVVPPSFLTIAGSPITATGTFTFGLVNGPADSYWGAHAAGAPGYLSFPPCSGVNQALNYTAGTGLACVTISGGSGNNPGPPNGSIQYNLGGVFGGFVATGDATITPSTGNVTVTGTGGTPFAASATTNALNATNINAGTLAAARGGAGTITGALRGSGAGVVTQAACSDLTNATSACSTTIGTSGANIPLLNGGNTWSSMNNFVGGFAVNSNTMTFPTAAAVITQTVGSGTAALGTSAVASGACASAVTVSSANVVSTDVVSASFNGDPTGVVGYQPSTAGMLTIIPYPGAGNVSFKVCNNTQSSITPGAITLNWKVFR
jgi:hypothetical protein